MPAFATRSAGTAAAEGNQNAARLKTSASRSRHAHKMEEETNRCEKAIKVVPAAESKPTVVRHAVREARQRQPGACSTRSAWYGRAPRGAAQGRKSRQIVQVVIGKYKPEPTAKNNPSQQTTRTATGNSVRACACGASVEMKRVAWWRSTAAAPGRAATRTPRPPTALNRTATARSRQH